MPKKIVYTCDKCGTEIIEGWLVYIERVRSHTEVDPYICGTIKIPQQYLCQKCFKEIWSTANAT